MMEKELPPKHPNQANAGCMQVPPYYGQGHVDSEPGIPGKTVTLVTYFSVLVYRETINLVKYISESV